MLEAPKLLERADYTKIPLRSTRRNPEFYALFEDGLKEEAANIITSALKKAAQLLISTKKTDSSATIKTIASPILQSIRGLNIGEVFRANPLTHLLFPTANDEDFAPWINQKLDTLALEDIFDFRTKDSHFDSRLYYALYTKKISQDALTTILYLAYADTFFNSPSDATTSASRLTHYDIVDPEGPIQLQSLDLIPQHKLPQFKIKIAELPPYLQKYYSLTLDNTAEAKFLTSIFFAANRTKNTFDEPLNMGYLHCFCRLLYQALLKNKAPFSFKSEAELKDHLSTDAGWAEMDTYFRSYYKGLSGEEYVKTEPMFTLPNIIMQGTLPSIQISNYDPAHPNAPLISWLVIPPPTMNIFNKEFFPDDPVYLRPVVTQEVSTRTLMEQARQRNRVYQYPHPLHPITRDMHDRTHDNFISLAHDITHCLEANIITSKNFILFIVTLLQDVKSKHDIKILKENFMSKVIWDLIDMDLYDIPMRLWTNTHNHSDDLPPFDSEPETLSLMIQKGNANKQLFTHVAQNDHDLIFLISMIKDHDKWSEVLHGFSPHALFTARAHEQTKKHSFYAEAKIAFYRFWNTMNQLIQIFPARSISFYVLAYRFQQLGVPITPECADHIAGLPTEWRPNGGLKIKLSNGAIILAEAMQISDLTSFSFITAHDAPIIEVLPKNLRCTYSYGIQVRPIDELVGQLISDLTTGGRKAGLAAKSITLCLEVNDRKVFIQMDGLAPLLTLLQDDSTLPGIREAVIAAIYLISHQNINNISQTNINNIYSSLIRQITSQPEAVALAAINCLRCLLGKTFEAKCTLTISAEDISILFEVLTKKLLLDSTLIYIYGLCYFKVPTILTKDAISQCLKMIQSLLLEQSSKSHNLPLMILEQLTSHAIEKTQELISPRLINGIFYLLQNSSENDKRLSAKVLCTLTRNPLVKTIIRTITPFMEWLSLQAPEPGSNLASLKAQFPASVPTSDIALTFGILTAGPQDGPPTTESTPRGDLDQKRLYL